MNKNCYHLNGPAGVKHASERIKKVLEDEKPQFFLRADIKSFYRSIPHYKLITDIKKYYNDPKLLAILENIITNPIESVDIKIVELVLLYAGRYLSFLAGYI